MRTRRDIFLRPLKRTLKTLPLGLPGTVVRSPSGETLIPRTHQSRLQRLGLQLVRSVNPKQFPAMLKPQNPDNEVITRIWVRLDEAWGQEPWELLCDPKVDDRFYACIRTSPVVRTLSRPSAMDQKLDVIEGPLRILAI